MMAVAAIAGTAMQMIGAHNAGEQAKSEANFQANQLAQNANNAEGAAEINMEEQNKRTAYAESNLQASAAAGGGSATDPTVVTDLKTIAGEGRFRAMTDMYDGNAQAQSMRTQAGVIRAGGDNAAQAGNIGAISSGLKGASSLYDSYNSNVGNTVTTPSSPAPFNPNQNGPYQLPWLQPQN